MTRRALVATLLSALAALRPLRALERCPCYRGSIEGGTAVVLRPDGSRLEPFPLAEFFRMASFPPSKVYKYGPLPERGFAWGRAIGSGPQSCQLAAALLMDHTGSRTDLVAGSLHERFAKDVLGELPRGGSWRLGVDAIDDWLARQEA